ncbi:RodZ domain-containing protein [Marinospirillum sp. MEB164]|uniref:RodZ domain-containing protein n=1 Tax=Marinospirillum alkalitolerans TaxID=3123374 RepID=A0ABW8PWH5_9GAMM
MTKTQEEQQVTEQPDLGPTPGALLKKAREAKGWSQKEVAQKLNFLPTYVPALEEGEYQLLPNTTFIRGYLRTYANLVDLDAQSLLEAFQKHSPDLNQPDSFSPVQSIKPGKKSGSFLFKLFSLLVILGLILLVTLWWQSRSDDALLPLVNEEVRVDTQQGPQILLPTSQPETEPAEPEAEPQEPQAAAEERETTAASVEAPQPASLSPAEEEPAAAGASDRSTSSFDPVSVTQNQPNRLALSFTDECWTEIRDANQRLLRSGLMRADEQLLVEGTPPFQVVFGNGRVAQIHYLGQAVDFNQRIRANGYTSLSIQ